MVNSLTGTLMFVAPEREAEYLAAGHHLVPKPQDGAASEAGAGPQAAESPGGQTTGNVSAASTSKSAPQSAAKTAGTAARNRSAAKSKTAARKTGAAAKK